MEVRGGGEEPVAVERRRGLGIEGHFGIWGFEPVIRGVV